jgi:hypothetical protein
MADIEDVLRRHEDRLMRLPNVVGVGIGEKDGQPTVRVLVSRKLPPNELRPDQLVPPLLEGFKTDVLETGSPAALDAAVH